MGVGAQQGADVMGFNEANKGANDLQAHLASPEGQRAIAELAQSLLSSTANVVYGRPAPAVGPSPLNQIAGIAGSFVGGGGGAASPAPAAAATPSLGGGSYMSYRPPAMGTNDPYTTGRKLPVSLYG